jgi:hypothetical protein
VALLTAAKPVAVRARLAARTATTPGRLTVYLTVIGILAALAGLAAVVGTAQRPAWSTRSPPAAVR